jgi:hypothetical protein
MNHGKGTFEVKMTPAPATDGDDSGIGRFTLDKRFAGDLEGTSAGRMLTAMTAVDGSAGYVAIETVTGRLAGRSGSFVLQHSATMDRSRPSQSIVVVPDSGTGELSGLSGTMTITIEDGQHFYGFDYALHGGD